MTDAAPVDFGHDVKEWLRKVSAAVNHALNGANRTVGEVTLTAAAASTTVTTPYATATAHITFTPLTANAAAEIGNGTIYVSARTNETSFVLTHANNAQADRTFTWSIQNK